MLKPYLCGAALVGLLLCSAGRAEGEGGWLTRLDEAGRIAAKENKELFIVFTGTAWCHPCVQFEKDVLSRQEFLRRVGPFVLVKLEYPKSDDDLPADVRNDFLAWRDRYDVHAFPTVFLADPAGRPYAVSGHVGLGAEAYARHVDRLRQNRAARDAALAKAGRAQGVEKARHLDAALAALGGAVDKIGEVPRDMLVNFYRPEIDQIIALDPGNGAGLRDAYRRLLGDRAEWERVAALDARFGTAFKAGGAGAALELIDAELARGPSVARRKRLQGQRRVYLEWGGRFEEALAYATETVEDDAYSPEERTQIRGRIAYNLGRLGRVDEAAAVYDRLVAGSGADHVAAWGFLRDKAGLLTNANRLTEALAAWDDSRRFAKEGEERWYETEVLRCRLLGRLGRVAEAVGAFDAVLNVASLSALDRANALAEKAMVLGKAGRRDEALSCAGRSEEVLQRAASAGGNESTTAFIRYKLRVARGEERGKN